MPIQLRSITGKIDQAVELLLRDLVQAVNALEPAVGVRARETTLAQAVASLNVAVSQQAGEITILQQQISGGGGGGGGAGGITELTGDVLAGPGSGSQPAILSNTGVVAGTYGDDVTVPQVTVTARGRVTSVVNIPITFPPAADDYVVMSDGATPTPAPVDDGFGNFVYIPYTP